MFPSDRQGHRRIFIQAWQKAQAGVPLEPLEDQIVLLLRQHPEYHVHLDATETMLDQDFPPELGRSNPFLHLGLHLAILEQLSIDQPTGIRRLYQGLMQATGGDAHASEHQMMDCLAEALWRSQRNQAPFDVTGYLDCIRRAAQPARSHP